MYQLASWLYESLFHSIDPVVEGMIVIVEYHHILTELYKILKPHTRSQFPILNLLKNDIRTHSYIINSSVHEGWDIESGGLLIFCHSCIPCECIVAELLCEELFIFVVHRWTGLLSRILHQESGCSYLQRYCRDPYHRCGDYSTSYSDRSHWLVSFRYWLLHARSSHVSRRLVESDPRICDELLRVASP